MSAASVTIAEADGDATFRFAGDLLIGAVERLRDETARARGSGVIDLGAVEALDTAGAWLIVDLMSRLEAEGAAPRVLNATDAQKELIETVRAAIPKVHVPPARESGFVPWLDMLGRKMARGYRTGVEMIGFLGLVLARTAGVIFRPWRLRWTSLVHHMQEVGYNAVPIVSLMAFLIGVVLAFQGAAQLRQFGAEVFVVDLIAISLLRELGILLTAIIVAGRSGSAFTASIGSMKMREEVDAMRTLGLDPIEVLVVPRFLALLLMLPILGIIANFAGLFGGGLMSWIELGVSPGMFQARMLNSIHYSNFLVGVIKAPFFAAIIAIVGCYQGMKVEGNAESLGRLTSKSVVTAIFLVIVADALFSVFFSLIDF